MLQFGRGSRRLDQNRRHGLPHWWAAPAHPRRERPLQRHPAARLYPDVLPRPHSPDPTRQPRHLHRLLPLPRARCPSTSPVHPPSHPRATRLRLETIDSRKARLGRTLNNLYRFLNLGSFIALLLGGVGVASAIHTYTRQKLPTVAVLRSLGATARQTVLIYLIQAGGMGLIGSLVGALLGVGSPLSAPQCPRRCATPPSRAKL